MSKIFFLVYEVLAVLKETIVAVINSLTSFTFYVMKNKIINVWILSYYIQLTLLMLQAIIVHTNNFQFRGVIIIDKL